MAKNIMLKSMYEEDFWKIAKKMKSFCLSDLVRVYLDKFITNEDEKRRIRNTLRVSGSNIIKKWQIDGKIKFVRQEKGKGAIAKKIYKVR